MPDTTEKPIADPWPREYHELSLPLSALHTASIYLPKEMTEAEWAVMTSVLAVMKRAIVPTERAVLSSSPTPAEEA